MFPLSKKLALILLSVGLLSCATGPDVPVQCFTCQKGNKDWWKSVSLMDLEGTWRGTETIIYKKNKGVFPSPKERKVELSFLSGDKFLRLYGFTVEKCSAFPKESIVVLHNILPSTTEKNSLHTFEVLGRTVKGYLSFGKVYVDKTQGEDSSFSCNYVRLGEFHENRLKLPNLSYSFIREDPARSIASSKGNSQPSIEETDVHFDFFYLMKKRQGNPNKAKRNLAQVGESHSPPVVLFEMVSSSYALSENFGRKKWIETEKRVFKLWPANE